MKARIGFGAVLLIAGAGIACGTPSASDSAAGERIYRRECYACHALEPGRDTAAGPTLHGIVGRPIAARPGFDYSPALRRLAARHERWSPELIDRFIAEPAVLAPGTEMSFAGLDDPARRRALIDWLGRLSDSD